MRLHYQTDMLFDLQTFERLDCLTPVLPGCSYLTSVKGCSGWHLSRMFYLTISRPIYLLFRGLLYLASYDAVLPEINWGFSTWHLWRLFYPKSFEAALPGICCERSNKHLLRMLYLASVEAVLPGICWGCSSLYLASVKKKDAPPDTCSGCSTWHLLRLFYLASVEPVLHSTWHLLNKEYAPPDTCWSSTWHLQKLLFMCIVWGRILGRNPDKSRKSFPPCYSQSPLYSFALKFLFLQTHATSYSFYSLATVHCKGERRKTWWKPFPLPHGLKGHCHEIFCFWFFSWISFPPAPEYSIKTVSNFFENSRRYSRLKVSTTPVANGKNLSSEKL